MKANYLSRNKGGTPRLKKLLILGAIFAGGAFVFPYMEGTLVSGAASLWKVGDYLAASISGRFGLVRSRVALVEENTQLKEEIRSLEIELSEAKYAGAARIPDSNIFIATVLSRPPQTPYDILILNIEKDESISLNFKIFSPEGAPLGRIFEIFGTEAKAKLFSTVGVETSAVLERHSIPVALIGAGGGNFKIVLPRDVAVEKGDKILALDANQSLLAIVEEVIARPTDSFKEALAKSPVNIFTLSSVLITQ